MKRTIFRTSKTIFIFIGLLITCNLSSQQNKNLAEMLGYPRDSKLLIIHADDMGLDHSVNTACIKAFENHGITSGSVMVPCPWTLELADYIRNHPDLDVGIHLTLTAEWNSYKWGGVTSSDQITSLLDSLGNFYPTVEQLARNVVAEEAGKEIHAQINRAIKLGINPTHIDTHMGSVLATPELVQIYLGLSEEYHLPILFPRAYLSYLPQEVSSALASKIFLLDNLIMLQTNTITEKWGDAYEKAIMEMKPGLNQLIVHIAIDNDEMKAVSKGHDDYGSAWRQHDLDFVLSNEFKELLKANNIIPIGWRQIRDLMNKPL
jgi:predicted glycoside hydrolase/deacetylase ChbG (UPF0249 family)